MNEKLSFNFEAVFCQKILAKNLYCAGGGWWVVGGGWWVDGGKKGPSILLKLKYVNNYVMKLLKKGIKVVTNFLMGLKICDEVGVRDAQFSKIP